MMTASRNTKAADPLAREAERVRYDADHRPVDRLGISYDDFGPNAPTKQPETGADRHDPPRRGTLDPYHPDAPGEDSPKDSPARPKAPAVFQATDDGRLYVPSADKGISGRNRKSGS